MDRAGLQANRDGVLLRYLRARRWDVPKALDQLRRGIAWRRACRVHEWHDPQIVSPRGVLADVCSQVYCCDSGYVDRRGRPYMVGAIELFDAPLHDPSKHLLAIYYVLERLVVHFSWPEHPNFCYVLDMAQPPDPPTIDFDVPNEVPEPVHTRFEGYKTLKRGLEVAQMTYPEVLDKVIVLNAGRYFQFAWRMFSVWLDAPTRAKFVVLGGGEEQKAVLLEMFEPSQLAAEFGGDAPSLLGYRERAILWYERGQVASEAGEREREVAAEAAVARCHAWYARIRPALDRTDW